MYEAAMTSLLPVDGECQQDVAGHEAERSIPGADVERAINDRGARTVHRSAFCLHVVDRREIASGVGVEDHLTRFGFVTAKVAVEARGEHHAGNRTDGSRL